MWCKEETICREEELEEDVFPQQYIIPWQCGARNTLLIELPCSEEEDLEEKSVEGGRGIGRMCAHSWRETSLQAQEVLLLSNQTQVNCTLPWVNMTSFHKNPFPPAVESKSIAPAVELSARQIQLH